MKITKVAMLVAVRARLKAFARTTSIYTGVSKTVSPLPFAITDTVSPAENFGKSTARNLVISF
jgi:hypothetical protein